MQVHGVVQTRPSTGDSHCIYAVELISKALRTVQCSTGVLTPMFTSSAFEFNLSRVYC
jgi:hypothetical protein